MKLTMGMDAWVDFQVILRQILLEAARRYYYEQFSNLNEGRTTKNKKVKSILSQLSTYAGNSPATAPLHKRRQPTIVDWNIMVVAWDGNLWSPPCRNRIEADRSFASFWVSVWPQTFSHNHEFSKKGYVPIEIHFHHIQQYTTAGNLLYTSSEGTNRAKLWRLSAKTNLCSS